jgi:molybdopterin molybdotransferase
MAGMANDYQPRHAAHEQAAEADAPGDPRLAQQPISVESMRAILCERAVALREWHLDNGTSAETLALADPSVRGRVLAADVMAKRSSPPCDVSSMDGFAFVAADDTWPKIVVGQSSPGADWSVADLQQGEALRIFTGAPLVAGADTVVPQEWCELTADVVQLDSEDPRAARPVGRGLFVRSAGSDVLIGESVGETGQLVSPALIGALSSAGIASVDVTPLVRVGVLATGNELVAVKELDQPDATLSASAVVDSARPTMLAAIAASGHQPVDLGHVVDDQYAIKAAVVDALTRVDVLITIGGVSVGDHDHLPSVLLEIAPDSFGRYGVDMQPGRPFASATTESALIAACPGNPVSVLVHWHVLLAPAVALLAGRDQTRIMPVVLGRLDAPVAFDAHDQRTRYLRAVVDAAANVTVLGAQQSHQLHEASHATHLAVISPGVTHDSGALVPLIPLV